MVCEMNHQNSTWNMPLIFLSIQTLLLFYKKSLLLLHSLELFGHFSYVQLSIVISHTQMFFFTIFCVTDDVFPTYIYLSSIIYLWNILYIWHQMWLCSQALLDQSEFSRMYLSMYQDMYLYPTDTVCLDDYLGLWNELHSYMWPSMS